LEDQMPTGKATVSAVDLRCKGDCSEQEAWRDWAPGSGYLRQRVDDQMNQMLAMVDEAGRTAYEPFEGRLIVEVFRLGRLLVALFLCLWEERTPVATKEVRGKETYDRQPRKRRWLGTFFGKVCYWRTYLLQTNGRAGGFFPIDQALGLTADGFSFGVLARVVRLATKMSYAAATLVCKSFIGWSPAVKTIEEATLGLGRYTTEWVEQRPVPADDGEVLAIQIDSKATPTAWPDELAKRRGKRQPNPYPDSPRHRRRHKRHKRGSKRRRKKGDKSKNGRMATLVVMYSLRSATDVDGLPMLKGPINCWVYASYAPKRHAFAIARREANKRGFTPDSGKRIQLMTDGDDDLARYAGEFFPKALHSLDVIHAVEYLWKAGACLHKEDSDTLRGWVEQRKDELYEGRIGDLIAEMEPLRDKPKTKKKRDRFAAAINYLSKRTHMMNYDYLAREDLELSSGVVEGAVRYVIAQRFDEGGMRWVKERAETLLQLRCIELNGEWDDFIAFAHGKICRKQRKSRRQIWLRQSTPEPLPTLGIN